MVSKLDTADTYLQIKSNMNGKLWAILTKATSSQQNEQLDDTLELLMMSLENAGIYHNTCIGVKAYAINLHTVIHWNRQVGSPLGNFGIVTQNPTLSQQD